MKGQSMAAEIAEQPQVLRRLLQNGHPEITHIAARVRDRAPRFVLFAGRGTSDQAALYGKYLVETQLGLPAGMISPSTTTLYRAHASMRDVLFIAVSQSGASPDIVEPVSAARMAGAVTVAMTNDPDSPLAGEAEFHADILAGPEQAVAATKTYTAELLALYLLIAGISGTYDPALQALPERAEAALSLEEQVAEIAVRYRFAEQLVVTSRGYNYPTSREAALKLMETSYMVAHAFSGADLLHGPMAMIRQGFPVVAIVPTGAGGEALRPVLERLHEHEADVWVIGDPEAARRGSVGLPLADLGPEILSAIPLIMPLQQFARHLSLTRGIDPDRPAGLEKVTRTR